MANLSLPIAGSNTFSNHDYPVNKTKLGDRTFCQLTDGQIARLGVLTGRIGHQIPNSAPFKNLNWVAVDPSTYARKP